MAHYDTILFMETKSFNRKRGCKRHFRHVNFVGQRKETEIASFLLDLYTHTPEEDKCSCPLIISLIRSLQVMSLLLRPYPFQISFEVCQGYKTLLPFVSLVYDNYLMDAGLISI